MFLLIWSLVKFLKSIGFLGVPLNMKHYSIPSAVEPFVVTGFLLLLLLFFFCLQGNSRCGTPALWVLSVSVYVNIRKFPRCVSVQLLKAHSCTPFDSLMITWENNVQGFIIGASIESMVRLRLHSLELWIYVCGRPAVCCSTAYGDLKPSITSYWSRSIAKSSKYPPSFFLSE